MGVTGSDVSRGLRWRSRGIVLYVDENHPNANAFNDGTDPENPVSTIAAAMARLVAYHALTGHDAANSVIVLAPATYTENIAIAGSGYPDYCTILGGGNGKYPVIWNCAAGDCLSIDKYGWRIEGIHFQPSSTGAGVRLTRVTGPGAEGTVIEDCFFNGGWGTGQYGIEFAGAPANVSILNCRFAEFDASSPAITVTDTSTADPYQTHIMGCTFQECAEYITSVVGGWNASVIMNNVFAEATGDLAATTAYIELGNGSLGYNTVTQNIFGGDYSIAGGYASEAGALDNWIGNIAYDMAALEVGTNGFTIALPA